MAKYTVNGTHQLFNSPHFPNLRGFLLHGDTVLYADTADSIQVVSGETFYRISRDWDLGWIKTDPKTFALVNKSERIREIRREIEAVEARHAELTSELDAIMGYTE